MSLRGRLLLLVVLATLVPAVLFGVRFFQNRATDIESALVALAIQASSIANDLDEKIQGTAQLQFGLARAGDLKNPNRAACSAFLSAAREEYPQYTGILTIKPDGSLFCDSLRTNRNLDLNDREYFKKALITKDAVTLQPVVGRLTGTSVLQIAYPARTESGQLEFVLLASFNLKKFSAFHRLRLSNSMDILLVDKSGIILASPAGTEWAQLIGTSIAHTELFRVGAGQTVVRASEVSGIDGHKQFWAAATTPDVRDAGLYVMVGISKDGLVAAANNRFYEDLTILAAVSLLLFAGVWTLAEIGVHRQVGRIAAMAKRLSAGDLSARIASPFPVGELGGLMRELNSAGELLEAQRTAIDELNRKLGQSQEIVVRTKTFLDTVFEHIPLPIAVKAASNSINNGCDWQFTLVNKAYENLTGDSRIKIIGKSSHDLYQKKFADVIIASDKEALESAAAIIGEYPLDIAENDTRLVTTRKVAIRDENGEPQYLLTVLDDVTEKRRSEKRIEHMAHHDVLTDLPNRAAFDECFAAMLAQAAAHDEQFAVLSIDLNRFKETNDVYGHAVGDALLQNVARRLQAASAGEFIARIGGDEFMLIVKTGEQPAAAAAIAERLLVAFVNGFEVEGKQLQIGLSIGAAIFPVNGTDAKALLGNADAALYRAKAQRVGSVLFFEPEMGVRLKERHALQQDLRIAIDRGELTLHYQPQVRITGEAIGFEALARWQCPKRGMVSPGAFIPIAEEYGLIIPLGEWALREACREAASWPQPLSIAVNVSPVQFHHGDLVSIVHTVLLETGLSPARLELEITEGVLISDFSRALSILCQLKALGVLIALDDFGTGYSSLSYLHSFAFDRIKIDRTFICDLGTNRNSKAIVRAVIGLGHSLETPILAEGVETELQRAFLAQEGCDEMQGYLMGRPLPIAQYAGLVGRQAIVRQRRLDLVS